MRIIIALLVLLKLAPLRAAEPPPNILLITADDLGHDIVGVWHSHTHTDPYPSPTDVRQAVDPMWIYVIVSLRDEAPMLRAYRIRDEQIAECAVVIDG